MQSFAARKRQGFRAHVATRRSADQVAEPGDYSPPDCRRTDHRRARADEKLRAFSNVCRHRRPGPSAKAAAKFFNAAITAGPTRLTAIARTPDFDGVECFSKEATACLNCG